MDRLLTRKQVAEFLGIQANTLARWKWAGKDGPPDVHVGRAIRYRASEVEKWIADTYRPKSSSARRQVCLKTPECIGKDATLYLRFDDVRLALKAAGVEWVSAG